MYGRKNVARIYQENAILTAPPGHLILMLFDGALRSMGVARAAFERPKTDHHRFETINKELIRAQSILLELKGTLNHQAGGEFAATMDGLYAYYINRLREGNLKKQVEPIIEVEQLVRMVRDAWAEMLRSQDADDARQMQASA